MKKIGVLRFPGTNCDFDVFRALKTLSYQPHWLWHRDRFNAQAFDGFVVPGGFSFGDYLRAGVLASMSPAIKDLVLASQKQKPILGICNGFQILCESGLLPGVLLPNIHHKFIDQWTALKPFSKTSYWTISTKIFLPIAHKEGRYFAPVDLLKSMEDKEQIWLQYTNNPNGSVKSIAGIFNKTKNVAALMPHPERAIFSWMGCQDGRKVLQCF